MGQRQSRLKLKDEFYRTQLDEIKKEEALYEEELGKQTDESHALVVVAQNEEAEKMNHLKDSLHHVEEGQAKRAGEVRSHWLHHDALRGYNMHIEVMKGELHEICGGSKKEFEKLKKKLKEEHRRYLEHIEDIGQMMEQQDEEFFAAMKKLHEKRVKEREKMKEELIDDSRVNHEEKLKMIEARFEKTTNSMGIIFYFAIQDALEKDMTIEKIRATIGLIEENRGNIDDWMIENDFKNRPGGLSPIRSNAEVNQALTYHKSMVDGCSLLLNQLSNASTLMSDTSFAHHLAPAKRAFGSAHHKASSLYEEMANLRFNLVKCHTVSLDGIKKGLDDLLLSINKIPSMITDATNQLVRDEMKKMEVNDDSGYFQDSEEVW